MIEKIRNLFSGASHEKAQQSSHSQAETKPSIFVTTLPKSGSVFIQSAVNRTLGLRQIVPSHGYFPDDSLNVDDMIKFAAGGYIAHSHCDPSEFNLRVLDYFKINWVLHLRDPRAALLSWTHHVERPDIGNNPAGSLRISPALPSGYFDLPFSAKLDWQIDVWFPGMVKWIKQWCHILDDPNYRDRIMLTTYERMHGRDAQFVGDIIERFHGVRPTEINLPPKDYTSHFRSGRRDEWRETFNPEQIKRATEKIGLELCERFNWEY